MDLFSHKIYKPNQKLYSIEYQSELYILIVATKYQKTKYFQNNKFLQDLSKKNKAMENNNQQAFLDFTIEGYSEENELYLLTLNRTQEIVIFKIFQKILDKRTNYSILQSANQGINYALIELKLDEKSRDWIAIINDLQQRIPKEQASEFFLTALYINEIPLQKMLVLNRKTYQQSIIYQNDWYSMTLYELLQVLEKTEDYVKLLKSIVLKYLKAMIFCLSYNAFYKFDLNCVLVKIGNDKQFSLKVIVPHLDLMKKTNIKQSRNQGQQQEALQYENGYEGYLLSKFKYLIKHLVDKFKIGKQFNTISQVLEFIYNKIKNLRELNQIDVAFKQNEINKDSISFYFTQLETNQKIIRDETQPTFFSKVYNNSQNQQRQFSNVLHRRANSQQSQVDEDAQEEIKQNLDKPEYDYDIKEQIYENNHTKVNVCQHKENGNYYIIKTVAINNNQWFQDKQNEINIFKQIQHDNVVKCFQTFENPNEYSIIMEKCDTNLENIILDNRQKKELDLSAIDCHYYIIAMKQLSSAVAAIHSKNIVHKDIKLSNIFVNICRDSFILKLGDFGLSQKVDRDGICYSSLGRCTLQNQPDEQSNQFGKPYDIYQLGLVFFSLWQYTIVNNTTIKSPVQFQFVAKQSNKDIQKIKEMIIRMVKPIQKERPEIKEIIDILKEF